MDLLDGVDDHLMLPLAATSGLGDFTLCLWIRTTESYIHPTNVGHYHQGVYDELRISSMARPPHWRFASWVNQQDPSAFFMVGGEEALP